MNKTVLVLAAGMGSRYGGIKQIEPVGPNGEIILDYSVYDAIRAGFTKAVFVIRRDIEQEFRNSILRRFANALETELVFQDIGDLPDGLKPPAERVRPWGTGHAIRAARNAIREPFAVINADDFYGADAFQQAGDFLGSLEVSSEEMCMVGYELGKTVSEHGSVSRGICRVSTDGYLEGIQEHTKVEVTPAGIVSRGTAGGGVSLNGTETVSMNLFGFGPTIFDSLETQFAQFLRDHVQDLKAEFYIPTVVNNRLRSSHASRLRVLRTSSTWFGITYREDRDRVVRSIDELISAGTYPERIWN